MSRSHKLIEVKTAKLQHKVSSIFRDIIRFICVSSQSAECGAEEGEANL